MSTQCIRWLPAEDDLVREWSEAGFTRDEIAAMLGRTSQAVKCRRTQMRIPFLASRQWTKEEDALVAEMCQFMSDAELGRLIGRTWHAVANRRVRALGMAYKALVGWAPDELRVLKAAFPLMPVDDVAAMLPGRTRKGVINMANRLGLRRRLLGYLPGGHVPLPLELREVIRLVKDLRKGIADEERRRSAGAAV